MRCLNPLTSGRVVFGCGQCMPCRFNRRRTWTHRIMLEALVHEKKCFVTLTYSDDHNDGQLHPEHLSGWLKRFRKHFPPRSIRFFAVGEYGDTTQRPHYHAAVFGLESCAGGPVRDGACQCSSCTVVRKTWGFGHVLVGTLAAESAQYLCGYVVKKMTHASDPRLQGRVPEFARMSLWPGIGAHALANIVIALKKYGQEDRLPSQLGHGQKKMPLGRYLRMKLSKELGHSPELKERLTDEALSEAYEQLQLVRSYAFATEKTVREVFREVNEPHSRQLEARFKAKARSL